LGYRVTLEEENDETRSIEPVRFESEKISTKPLSFPWWTFQGPLEFRSWLDGICVAV
jgi:hypothetical protein